MNKWMVVPRLCYERDAGGIPTPSKWPDTLCARYWPCTHEICHYSLSSCRSKPVCFCKMWKKIFWRTSGSK